MEILLIIAMLVLLILVVLPFWMGAPKVSSDQRLVQGVLPPGTRRYTMIKPGDMHPNQSIPLVVALHFGGHGMPFYGELFLTDFVEPGLRELDAIMVSPDCPAKDWTQPESERFVLDLIDWIFDQYPVDPKRVLLAGFSMGGIGVWHLLQRFPERFSAAIVMAAQPPDGVEDLDWEGPLCLIHGRDDELFPLVETNQVAIALEKRGYELSYRILESVTHYQTHKYRAPLVDAVPWIQARWG